MGLVIEQSEKQLKLSIPLHHEKGNLIYNLRKLADELETKEHLTNRFIENIGFSLEGGVGSLPSLDITLSKNMPFNRKEYFNCDTLDEILILREKNKEGLEDK